MTAVLRAWGTIAYLFLGLHSDGCEDADSEWPRALRPFAAEAWRRAATGELSDEELYCSDAAWSGLYDRMLIHLSDETEHRLQLATGFGQSPAA